MPHICLTSNDMFASQSSPKILLDLNKETIFIAALEKMDSLVSETQIRYFWKNCSKWALENYAKDLQPGFPHLVRTSCSNFKNLRR